MFHYLSLALLTFFMVELFGKLFAFRLEFFQHKFEVFDGLVVTVSFILDIVFIFHEDAFDGTGLLILLRLWRVARIVNGQSHSAWKLFHFGEDALHLRVSVARLERLDGL